LIKILKIPQQLLVYYLECYDLDVDFNTWRMQNYIVKYTLGHERYKIENKCNVKYGPWND
jgi:hypothetical protein